MDASEKYFKKVWIPLLTAGITSLVFGITVCVFREIPLISFLWLRAIYMFIKGISLTIVIFRAKGKETWWDFLLCFELVSMVASIVATRYPEISIIILSFIVSINLLISGILQLVVAFYLPRAVHRKWGMVATGVITLLAGMYIYIIPKVSSATILILFAIDLLALGLFLLSLSLAVRKLAYS